MGHFYQRQRSYGYVCNNGHKRDICYDSYIRNKCYDSH
jgi:hypothetical protein